MPLRSANDQVSISLYSGIGGLRRLQSIVPNIRENAMINHLKSALCLLLCLAIAGNAACTTTHSIDATAGSIEQYNVGPGDEVELRFQDNSVKAVTVVTVDETGISGVDEQGETVNANYDDLKSVKFTAVDGCKTAKNTAKAVGIVAIVAVVAGAMAAAALTEGFSFGHHNGVPLFGAFVQPCLVRSQYPGFGETAKAVADSGVQLRLRK